MFRVEFYNPLHTIDKMSGSPDFCSMLRASGLAETWTHCDEIKKLHQFGWRCTNKESSYGNKTLIGNWNERRFDLNERKKAKSLPSQVNLITISLYKCNFQI